MITLALIGAIHRALEPRGLTRLSRGAMFATRAAVGVVFCCLPLVKADVLSATSFLGIAAGLTTLVVVEETYGKLHNAAAADAESDSDAGTVIERGDIVEVVVENAELVEVPAADDLEAAQEFNEKDAEEDLSCNSWREWAQMEKARRERMRAAAQARASGKALKKSEKISKRVRQWQKIQEESRQVNVLAGACGGG